VNTALGGQRTGVTAGAIWRSADAYGPYYRSAQTLIADRQPVEALPSLRGLITIAARFEQMTEEHGDGLGLAARLALDSLARQPGDYREPRRAALAQAAADEDLVIPAAARPIEATAIWRSLAA
jgi:hypothetical protein